MLDTPILCDLDGVAANFEHASLECHNRGGYVTTTWAFWEDWGMTSKEFFDKIALEGISFYKDRVQPYPWLRELVSLISAASSNVTILSQCNDDPIGGYAGKKEWINKHLKPICNWKSFIGDGAKALLAAPGRLLIDDSTENVKAWKEAGGSAFLFPQPWNTPQSGYNRMELLRSALEQWKVGKYNG